ncbi:methyltransferase [Virgisporangium aliadipatigenens]|uniref:Methyltransferase n=1 Tax=Virgisporangium aliadipatigenens TaxID=741659 RepID=A0A8J3YU38_9ACTN|nr:class I SAM-dependent methyltransferase [Virgisporangium aliadipatigenens]GIJ49836.1 methyltransferase [Virgisporangium aliadipatigenens]
MTGRWEPDLYRGTAAYYADGRMPYPAAIATALRDLVGLDGRGRLLDVGCGPGPVTRLLAPMFEAAVGVDPDPEMLAEAARRTGDARVTWHRARAEELPDGLGVFRMVTFAQSFHWMDRLLVARNVRSMIEPGGVWVHVGATTHQGVEGDDPLPRPRVPHAAIRALIAEYLGPPRQRPPLGPEEEVMRAAGYGGPRRLTVGGDEIMIRTSDQVVAAVHSLSFATPHLFGERRHEFESDLRRLLLAASPEGLFAERTRDVELVVWTR